MEIDYYNRSTRQKVQVRQVQYQIYETIYDEYGPITVSVPGNYDIYTDDGTQFIERVTEDEFVQKYFTDYK